MHGIFMHIDDIAKFFAQRNAGISGVSLIFPCMAPNRIRNILAVRIILGKIAFIIPKDRPFFMTRKFFVVDF